MFDAFDDDFSEDQSFLFDSLMRNAVQVAPKQSSCEFPTPKPANEVAAAFDEKIPQCSNIGRETPSKSRLRKFSFVRRNSSHVNEDIAAPCTSKRMKNDATSTSELQNSNNADLLVLQCLDFDSLDKDGFNFDDSNSDDSISISTPLNVNHSPNAADRLFVPLPITNNIRTNYISSGSSRSNDPKYASVPTLAISNESDLTKNNKNAIGRSKGILENSEVGLQIIANQNVQTKRKFPGPAGLLPKFSRLPDSNQLFRADISLLNAVSDKKCPETVTESQLPPNMEISCSQISEDSFQKAPWLAMMKDISKDDNSQHQLIVNKFNISAVLKQANNQKAHSSLKYPMLCVVIHSINSTEADASAVFKDKTGSVSGMICQKLMQEFRQYLLPGSVLVLKQIMILKLPSKRCCLNITPLSVVALYSENDSGSVEHLTLNPISWSALLQEANESPPSTSLRRTCLSSMSVSPYMSTPVLSPADFPSLSNRAVKYGKNNFSNSTNVPHRLSTVSTTPMVRVDSSNYTDPAIHRNLLRNVHGDLGDNSIPSNLLKRQPSSTIPNEDVRITECTSESPSQKSSFILSTGCDLTDDPLWTDDDFDSMLLDIDMTSAT